MMSASAKDVGVQTAAQGSASKDFEDFVYLLSHDVRNSVRALLEVPHWIKEDLEADGHPILGSLAENFELMETQTRRMDRMLIDLLAYSRVGRNQTVQPISLNDAIQVVIDQLAPPPSFKIKLDIASATLRIGEQDVLTLLSSLISNAVKHQNRNRGSIHISSKQSEGECILRIQDDGPGIPEKHRERVFDAMTTLKPRDEVEGSGMGLAIVRKIVEFYGGRLRWAKADAGYNTALEISFKT